MPPRTSRKRSTTKRVTKRRPTAISSVANPPQEAITYAGPIITAPEKRGMDLITVVLSDSYAGFFTTDASGNFAGLIDSKPSALPYWSNWSGLYAEYRVLAVEVSYYPNNRYARGSVSTRPVIAVLDRVDAGSFLTSLTSYAVAVGSPSHRICSFDDPFKITWKMSDAYESEFFSCSAPVTMGGIKFYSSGNSASAAMGLYVGKWRIQFRNKLF
jgi:hypothetical protein